MRFYTVVCFIICSSYLIFAVCAVEPTEWEGRDGSPQGLYRGKPKADSVPDWSGGFAFFFSVSTSPLMSEMALTFLRKYLMDVKTPCIKWTFLCYVFGVFFLWQGHPVNLRDYCGWTPLHEACNYGHQGTAFCRFNMVLWIYSSSERLRSVSFFFFSRDCSFTAGAWSKYKWPWGSRLWWCHTPAWHTELRPLPCSTTAGTEGCVRHSSQWQGQANTHSFQIACIYINMV